MSESLEFVGASELAYLSSLTIEGEEFYVKAPQRVCDGRPLFEGTIPEFVAANPELEEQMRNVAKRCPACGKTCATILPFCNGCDRNMSDAAEEYTENICMGFIYGIQRTSRFPLTLSMRLEEEHVLVYDDLLARSSCHLNAIPSDCYLPDWRHLLRNPAKGRVLMERLDSACWKVVKEQFWDNEDWRTSHFREGAFTSAEDFRSQITVGVNSVPSQFQIHLQYIVPPISPSDYYQFLHGKRFLRDRWLPLEYVMESLKVLSQSADSALEEAHTMTMEDIFASISKAGGPVYEEAHGQAIRRYNQTHRRCANWKSNYFEVAVVARHPSLRAELLGAAADSVSAEDIKSVEVRPLRPGVAAASLATEQLEKKDKKSMQSYGRPYNADGLPAACSYYRFARSPGSVQPAEQWASTAVADS